MIQPSFFTSPQPLFQQLCSQVVRCDYKSVSSILKKNPELMVQKGTFDDLSGRRYNQVSPFMYALWAWDRWGWKTMLSCVPSDQQARCLYDQLLAQYEEIKNQGISYMMADALITESHFNFQPIMAQIDAYQRLDLLRTGLVPPPAPTLSFSLATQFQSTLECKSHWDSIGLAQRLLPVAAVFSLCRSDEELKNSPPNNTLNFNRDPDLFGAGGNSGKISWFDSLNPVGNGCAIYKSSCPQNGSFARAADYWHPFFIGTTRMALNHWHQSSENEFECLGSELRKRVSLLQSNTQPRM